MALPFTVFISDCFSDRSLTNRVINTDIFERVVTLEKRCDISAMTIRNLRATRMKGWPPSYRQGGCDNTTISPQRNKSVILNLKTMKTTTNTVTSKTNGQTIGKLGKFDNQNFTQGEKSTGKWRHEIKEWTHSYCHKPWAIPLLAPGYRGHYPGRAPCEIDKLKSEFER